MWIRRPEGREVCFWEGQSGIDWEKYLSWVATKGTLSPPSEPFGGRVGRKDRGFSTGARSYKEKKPMKKKVPILEK